MSDALRGVFSAVATPVLDDLTVDRPELLRHARQLLDDGCHGLAVLGSTGEANAFSMAERMSLLEHLVEGGIDPSRLMPGTGVCALPETVQLTRHALSLGVTDVVVLPPFYYKGVPDSGIIDAYSYVIDKVADPRLRVVLYHIPQISQVPISDTVIDALIRRFGPVLAGVKDSGGDLAHMQGLVASFPGLSVFAGADPLMLPLLRAGGSGCITATSNLLARELRIVFDGHAHAASADRVSAAQDRIDAIRAVSNSFIQIPTIKAMIARRYRDEGWRRVCPPFTALTDAQCRMVDEQLDTLDREMLQATA